jgi:tetratricopeptide (TPR) repeat protein
MAEWIKLTLVAGLTLAITASPVTPSLAQKGLAAESARINALMSAGKYSEALPLAQGMVASLEKSDTGRDLAAALNNLGQVHAGQGHDDLAEPLYKRAIVLMEKSLGLETPLIGAELTNLAALYQRQSRYAEAEPLFRRALAVREKGCRASIPMSASPSTISPRSM